jgi:hypothetical protein
MNCWGKEFNTTHMVDYLLLQQILSHRFLSSCFFFSGGYTVYSVQFGKPYRVRALNARYH